MGKWILYRKGRSFPFGSNCQNRFLVRTDYAFQIKFCIKICNKPPSSGSLFRYNCFTLVFTSSADNHFSQLFRTSSFNIIIKKIFVTNFPFLITDSLKPIHPLQHNNSQNLLSMMKFFLLMLAKCSAKEIKDDTSNSPDILALCETNFDDSIYSGNFSVRGYLPQRCK